MSKVPDVDEYQRISQSVMCPRCDQWEATVELPLKSKLVDTPEAADAEADAHCDGCGEVFPVYYVDG